MEARAKQMVANEELAKKEEKNIRLQQYIEGKVMKGHSEEQAIMMANALLMDKLND